MLYELLFDVIVSDFEGEFGELVWGVADGEEGVSSGERHLTSSFYKKFIIIKEPNFELEMQMEQRRLMIRMNPRYDIANIGKQSYRRNVRL
jgi:hypothetical protein